MPEILCPMCSKTNDAGAEACAFCGARLKPLVIDSSSDDMQADVTQETVRESRTPEEPVERKTDWLGRLRSKVGPTEEPEPSIAEGTGELPDWLDRLRSPGDTGAAEEVQEIIDPGEKSGDTDWLNRLRKVESASELTDADWDLIENEIASSPEHEQARPEIPDWLKAARKGEDERTEIEEEPETEALEGPLDFSQRLAKHSPEPPKLEEAAEQETSVPDEVIGELEVGLDAPLDFSQRLARHSPEPPKLEEADEQETSVPDEVIGEPEVSSEDSEEELEAQVPDMVYVPALIIDEEPAPEPAAAEDDEQQPGISRAVLPEWLEAMRPDEINRIQDQAEGDEPQSFETIGPLAGLSGVLMAEPVVAMPRTPGTVAVGINITQQENEQVRILRKLVEAERQDIASPAPRPRAAPILQWIVGLVLVAAVILPQVLSGEIFAAPRWVPQDLNILRNLVEELAVDTPALIVVDYDPGYSAELEAVGSSLLDHLFQRGMRVVTLSTRSPGPALAQRLIEHVTPWHVLEPGDDYLHLGYLAGGPTAVQLFASNPRYGNLRGFMLPAERDWNTPWEAPILADVQQLSDFSAVLVITAGTETARTWAEQAAPLTGESPFIMVLSAGAEPLVRPYYSNPDPQVDAIFTGLPSAKANELTNGRSGGASLLWDAFGTGGWAATGILVVGSVMGIAASLLRRRARDENDV